MLVGDDHFMGEETMAADRDFPVRREDHPDESGEIADFDTSLRAEVEEATVVNPAGSADADRRLPAALEMEERERAVEPASRTDRNIRRHRLGEPIVFQLHVIGG